LLTDDKYLIIDNEDVLLVLKDIKDESTKRELISLYNDIDHTDLSGKIRIKKDSKIAKVILEKIRVIDEDITLNLLLEALGRAIYEFNHNMKNKLSNYYRKLMDTLIKKQDESVIYELIRNDKEVYNYIKMYKSMNDYIEVMIKKRLDKKEPKKVVKEDRKSKSYVMI